MNKNIKSLLSVAVIALSLSTTSCTGDLDVTPINPNMNTEVLSYALFNKCYANLAMAGNSTGDDKCDIDGLDGGTSGFVRQLWNSNELTNDEAICHWGDDGIRQYCYNTYDASHPMLNGLYARLTTGISYCNQYINECGAEDATKTAEIRFIRALEYYFLMDAFGNIPFATELTNPTRKTRAEMYEWLESELLEIEPEMSEAKAKNSSDAGYYRADKAAVWMLLSRLYLNAEVYTGTAQWSKAAEYAKKVIDSDYQLNTTGSGKWSAYQMLFMGDNGETSAAKEGIFRIGQDGTTTTSWAGTLFLMASTFDGGMHADVSGTYAKDATNGTGQTWGGNRARTDLINKFFPNNDAPNVSCTEMPEAAGDDRAIFDGKDRKLDNGDGCLGTFTDGFAVAKWINFKTDGSAGHNDTYPDTDFFLFRKAEAYLTYAEATARANGGTLTSEGVAAVNALRARAHAEQKAGYTLSELCDEWSREFYFEGLRRPTLIRFGRFGGNNNYNWSYKGGTKAGRNFSADKNIFAIPAEQVTSTITQNPGY